jgi:drug/metabolite transporter (DMT)-like permease
LRTALLLQHLADELAERVHVIAQGLMLGWKVDLAANHGGRGFYLTPNCGMRVQGQVTGTLLVAGSAMLFASKGLFAKALYARGIGFELLVTVRSFLALPLFLLFVSVRVGLGQVRSTPLSHIAIAALAGFLCYYVGALVDFYALTMIDVSIERVLLFSYPAIVVLFTAFMTRKWPGRGIVAATSLTYVGIFFVMGGFDPAALRDNFVGGTYVLVAAVTTATYFMLGERFIPRMGAGRFTLFGMTAATTALVAHFLAHRSLSELVGLTAPDWWLLIGLAIVCTFLPALMQTEGVQRLGAQRAAVVSTAGPPTTILLGWMFLGERLSLWQVLGVVLILVGIVVVDLVRARKKVSQPASSTDSARSSASG